MFILDSLFISGLQWVLDKVVTVADAELNDDTVLREELLAAEMRREMGEISDQEFADIEADLLARMREIKERREGGGGPLAFGRDEAASDSDFQVEATVSGDFHEPASAGSGSVIEGTLIEGRLIDQPPAETRRAARAERPARGGRTGSTSRSKPSRNSRTSRPTR